jgi:pimeloyl-ACP methyl ester carboxylesterase
MSAFDLSQHHPDELPINPGAKHYADINGLRMCYYDQGEGEPILFIHGGGACIETWHYQLEDLQSNFRLVAPDCRGHGRTNDTDEAYSHELHASDMIKLLDHLNIEKAHLVGWSDGSFIALQMALDYQERIKSMVLLGAAYSIDNYSSEGMDAIKNMSASDYYPFLIELYKTLSPTPDKWNEFFEKCRVMWLQQPNHSLTALANIHLPTLIIMAGQDEWAGNNEAKQMQSTLVNCQLLNFPDADHSIHMTNPDVINKCIREFLEKEDCF